MATAVDPVSTVDFESDRFYRLTADDYYRMVNAEIIPADRRVYLWDGRLFEKMGKNQPHAVAHNKLVRALSRMLPAQGWFLSNENPVEIAEDKVPLPDLAVLRGDPDDYPTRPPVAADIGLLVEVMDTSAAKDLGTHLRAYAAARVPRYWVINVRERCVEVFTEPTATDESGRPAYAHHERKKPGESVVLHLEGADPIAIPVEELLPGRSPNAGP